MEHQELEGHSCLEKHPDHLQSPNLGQQSRRLHGKGVVYSWKKVKEVKEAAEAEMTKAKKGEAKEAKKAEETETKGVEEANETEAREAKETEAREAKETEAREAKETEVREAKETEVKEANEAAVKAAARSLKELDLKDKMTSMKWATMVQKEWVHGIRIQPGEMFVCVWYVHLYCESVGYKRGTQWLAVKTQEYAHYELEVPFREYKTMCKK